MATLHPLFGPTSGTPHRAILFLGHHWLVSVDAFSNWIEIQKAPTPSTSVTTKLLKELFTRFGFPDTFVTDNGPAFRSEAFRKFCTARDIVHVLTPPYHPQSNGLAERAVRTFKELTKKFIAAGHPLKVAVQQMLLTHRISKKSKGEKSPSEKAFGRNLKTKLSLTDRESLHPTSTSQFLENQLVWFRSHAGDRWKPGRIHRIVSRKTFMVAEGEILHFRHEDQIRPAGSVTPIPVSSSSMKRTLPLPSPDATSKRPRITPPDSEGAHPRVRPPSPEPTGEPPSPPSSHPRVRAPDQEPVEPTPMHPRIRAPDPEPRQTPILVPVLPTPRQREEQNPPAPSQAGPTRTARKTAAASRHRPYPRSMRAP